MTNGLIVHKPWLGPEYTQGIDGKRFLVVGYSHHEPDGKDDADITMQIIRGLIAGTERGIEYGFFGAIRNRFGFGTHEEFWPRVGFMNFVPNLIGRSDDRFAYATPQQIADGNVRLAEVVRQAAPDYVLVFSTKAWNAIDWGTSFPPSTTSRVEDDGHAINVRKLVAPEARPSCFVGLRHPQGGARAHYMLLRKVIPEHHWT